MQKSLFGGVKYTPRQKSIKSIFTKWVAQFFAYDYLTNLAKTLRNASCNPLTTSTLLSVKFSLLSPLCPR
ncbi:hypothetical protein CQA40_07415 [Helicobacter sp. MIT 01-3238]|nr:hypothetical protein CQA40_07415 [Helicobacter sp. MIT 01-3238]